MSEPVPLVSGIIAAFASLVALIVWVVKRDTRSREALEKVQSQAFTHTIPRLADTFQASLDKVIAASERREALLLSEHREDRVAWRDEMQRGREAAERRERLLLDELRAIRPAPGDKG